ncbi:MAG: hypothetical protein V3S07_06830, partial [Micropepsaceae bacterium]
MNQDAVLPFGEGPGELETVPGGPGPYGKYSTGILPSHILKRLIHAHREILATDEILDQQI